MFFPRPQKDSKFKFKSTTEYPLALSWVTERIDVEKRCALKLMSLISNSGHLRIGHAPQSLVEVDFHDVQELIDH